MSKKILVSLGTIVAIAAPVAAVVSCGTSRDTISLVVPQASSMNFIRYKASAQLAGPTVLPFEEGMPTDSLKNKYQLKSFKMKSDAGGVITMKTMTYGSVVPDEHGETIKLDQSGKNLSIVLRANMNWSNGDKLVAENWVDTIKAMLDLNNASEYVIDIERMGFKNATESYDAQIEYFRVHHEAYADPFNYNKLPTSRDLSKVDYDALPENKKFPDILNPCLDLGVESDGTNKLLIHFNHKETLNFALSIQTPIFWPINRKFIMGIGGFDKFGMSTDTMVSSGAYVPDYFDAKYGIEFSQNQKYYNRNAVVTPHVNFRFVTDPNTTAALFETGQILKTSISKDYINTYLSTPSLRRESKRASGIGTLSMFLNRSDTALTKEKRELFANENFRKALYYGINRSQLLPALQLPFSNPVGLYTAAVAKTQDAQSYIQMYSGVNYNAAPSNENGMPVDGDGAPITDPTAQEASKIEKPMLISPPESRGFAYSQDFFKRDDIVYDKDLAQRYLAQAEKDLGHDIHVNLDYPYDSSDPIGKSVSVVLQDFIQRTFGDKITVVPKALPKIVYSQYINSGQWDLQIKQVDPLTRRPWDYLGEFIESDDVDPQNGKKTGFIKNNTGGATYKKWFISRNENQERKFREDFGFDKEPAIDVQTSKFSYDMTKWFLSYENFNEEKTINGHENEFAHGNYFDNDGLARLLTKYEAKYEAHDMSNLEQNLYKVIKDFDASEFTAYLKVYNDAVAANNSQDIQTSAKKLIQSKVAFMESTVPFNVSFTTIYKVIESIQRDMVPVIPLAEADNKWVASRSAGATTTPQGQWVNPEYLYNADHKPYPWLEGVE